MLAKKNESKKIASLQTEPPVESKGTEKEDDSKDNSHEQLGADQKQASVVEKTQPMPRKGSFASKEKTKAAPIDDILHDNDLPIDLTEEDLQASTQSLSVTSSETSSFHDDDESEDDRSILSKLTGGLFNVGTIKDDDLICDVLYSMDKSSEESAKEEAKTFSLSVTSSETSSFHDDDESEDDRSILSKLTGGLLDKRTFEDGDDDILYSMGNSSQLFSFDDEVKNELKNLKSASSASSSDSDDTNTPFL
jgi:hypothetical protein